MSTTQKARNYKEIKQRSLSRGPFDVWVRLSELPPLSPLARIPALVRLYERA